MGDVRQGCVAYVLLRHAFGRDSLEIIVLGFDVEKDHKEAWFLE